MLTTEQEERNTMTCPRLSFTALLCLLALSWPGQQAHSQAKGATLLIQGGWLFDGISDTRRPNRGLVIRNGIIAALEADPEQADLANATGNYAGCDRDHFARA